MASDHDPKGAEASGKGAEPHIVTLSVIKGHAQKLPPGAHRLLNGKKKRDGKCGFGLKVKRFPYYGSPLCLTM